jgi:hypothetical protein
MLDVRSHGMFYHGSFRHLGHVTLERFVTFTFCALGHFVAASFQHMYPNSTSLQYSLHVILSSYILLCGEKYKESMLV